jgi:hypothetical protein
LTVSGYFRSPSCGFAKKEINKEIKKENEKGCRTTDLSYYTILAKSS